MVSIEQASLTHNLVLSALSRYFRVELTGATDELPDWGTQPCLFVMNHTAVLGLEVYLLYAALDKLHPGRRRIRTTVWAPFLKAPVLGKWYESGGALAMNIDSVADALREGDSVLVLPEGPDATDVRDEVGPFHAGFMRAVQKVASDLEVPIVPLGWSGVDEAMPWFVTTHPLAVTLLMKPVYPGFDFAIIPRLPMLRPSKVIFTAGTPFQFGEKDLDTEEKLRAAVADVRQSTIALVADATRRRRQVIASSARERVIHSTFRMHNILWRRR